MTDTTTPPTTPDTAPSGLVRTVVTIEVLGQRPFTGDIEDIADACVDGDFSGLVLATEHTDVDASTMADLLLAQGSDPSFLGLVKVGPEQWVTLPRCEADAVTCEHGQRVWRDNTCHDCFGD